MDFEAFQEIVKGRRSIRRFTATPVQTELIHELVDCARYAPSDTNSQTWEFIAILDPNKIRAISDLTWTQLNRIAGEAEAQGLVKEARLLLRSFGPYATAFVHAPALIVVLSTPYTSKFRDKIFEPLQMVSKETWDLEGTKSSCLAAQNFMLAAHAMGLATCPMTGPVLLAEAQLKEFLNIDEEKHVNMVLALGYSDEKPSAPKRREVDEILRIIE
ncbi:MAG: NAD(P)H nitroreductase [Alicyclobacillus sp. RIFOXYA1_FULL_53_8]|nr:MAG: NAD(P)H nitroreductase [Alicyclobacillus sp. RIFOXYA1_FULL_53_8]